MSFEMLNRSFGANLYKTETEIPYWPIDGSITDYACKMFDSIVGVSVTRAMKYNNIFEIEDAIKLLRKKLNGINNSSKRSLIKWNKQILHVWTLSQNNAELILRAWSIINTNLKSNTTLLLTIAKNCL